MANLLKLKHKEYFFLAVILLIAAFLRLYRISDYMTFLGDEGRDVLVAKHIIEGIIALLHGNFHAAREGFTLLGPRASAGDFFTGPIYYYFMVPFLWIFRFDPVGPAVMIALLGIATVLLVYYAGKKFFGTYAGISAALLYAISPLVVGYSRSSWNPNPLPFFSLLILYLLYNYIEKPTAKKFILIGILFGITLQLHYIATFLGVIIFSYILFYQILFKRENTIFDLIKKYVTLFIGFIVGYSLFLAFEILHGFPNTRTILQFIFASGSERANAPFLETITNVAFRLYARLITYYPPPEQIPPHMPWELRLLQIGTVLLVITSIIALWRLKNKKVVLLFSLWLFLGVSLFGLYKKSIYDYYFEFMFPLPFLLIGNLLEITYKAGKLGIGKIISISVLFLLVWINVQGIPFRSPPNKQKDQVKQISEFVLAKTDNKQFNFALLTPGNSDHGYRYFFEIENKKPVVIENLEKDPQRKSVTDQLMIVCEAPNCHPLGVSLWEVAGFGRAEIANQWNVSVVTVYKLTHYKGKDNSK